MKRVLGPHGLVAAALMVAPLAAGSVHSWPRTILGLLLLGAVVWMFGLRAHRLRLDAVGLGLLLALVWTLFQMVPLPLSPSSGLARDAAGAAKALGDPVSWVPITRDVGASAELAWYLAAALSLYLVVLRSTAPARRVALQCIALSGGLMVVSGAVHAALGATTLFGVYTPQTDLGSMRLPMALLNPNHAAVFLILCAASAWILATTTTRPKIPQLYRAIALLCLGGVVATDSHAGVVVMAGGVVGLVYLRRKTDRVRSKRRNGPEILLIIPIALVGVWALESDVALSHRWSVGWDVVRDHLGLGAGGGAFPMAASTYQSNWANGQLTFAHNGILQAAAEWGVVAAAGIGILLLAGLVSAWRTAPVNMGRTIALVAVAGAVVANQVEFSLWLPGVGLPATALLAWGVADARRSRRIAERDRRKSASKSAPSEPRSSRRHTSRAPAKRSARVGVAVLCIALTPVGVIAHHDALIESRDSARAYLTDGDLDALIDAARRHPSDQNIWLHAAKLLAHRKDSRAAGAVRHALSLAPKRVEHLLLCGLHSEEQQALECLERSTRMGAKARGRAAAAALARGDGFAEAFGRRSGGAAISLSDALKSQGFRVYSEAIRWAYEQHPSDPLVCERLVMLWSNDGRRHDALGAMASTIFARADQASSATDASRLRRSAYLALGAAALKADPKAAAHAFEAAAREVPQRASEPLLRAMAIWLDEKQPKMATRLMKRLEKSVVVSSLPAKDRVRFHALRSRVASMSGDRMKAMAELRRARAFAPNDAGLRDRYQRLRDSKDPGSTSLLR